MSRVLVALAVLVLACHHDSGPAVIDPADHPPLPPSSGTPVGYIIDDAGDLHLTDDQVTKLKAIDAGLSARIESIDAQLRAYGKAPPSQSQNGMRGRRGGRGMGGGGMGGGMNGGMGGGGMGGGGMGGGGGRRSGGGGSGSGSGSGSASAAHAADIARLTEERASEVRDALQRSFALLDDKQQAGAKLLLDDNGIDLDAGRPTTPTKLGDGEQDGDADSDGGDETARRLRKLSPPPVAAPPPTSSAPPPTIPAPPPTIPPPPPTIPPPTIPPPKPAP